MSKNNNPTDVFTAIDLLLEEVKKEIDNINQAGSEAFERSDYDVVDKTRERAARLTAFQEKIVSLRKEWETLMVTIKDNTKKEVIQARQRDLGTKRRNPGRLSGGLCTQGVAYYQPILKALYKSGGSARVRDVLKKLEQSMEGVLKSEDREPLSTGKLRWRETAEWAAIKMKKEGLLKPTSESGHGIWEITEAGRKSLTD